MTLRRSLTVAVLLPVAATAFVVAATAGGWVGDSNAWRMKGSALQATTNGGASWRTIFRGEGDPWRFAHTGAKTGIYSLGAPGGGEQISWTTDNGRHWYDATTAIREHYALEGHGTYLFWSDFGATSAAVLNRVKPWPPRPAQTRCKRGKLQSGNGSLYCAKPGFAAPLRSSVVARVPAGRIFHMANVPGGIAALVSRGDASVPLFRVVVHRNGRSSTATLPALPAPQEGQIEHLESTILASWPELTVIGYSSARASVVAVWSSSDGGASWKVAQ